MKYQVTDLGKPQKKVLLLMAGPLKGGWGVIKEKITFFGTFFLILLPFKN